MPDNTMSDRIQVQQVLALYVRAADRRDGAALAGLFTPNGRVEISYNNQGVPEPVGVLEGREAIAHAVTAMMRPHPPRGWSHHTTHDPLIEVDGDRAVLDTQFVVFNALGAEEPADGWPKEALGLQGTVTPIESGYYRPTFRRADGQWRIEILQILHDLPMAMPRA